MSVADAGPLGFGIADQPLAALSRVNRRLRRVGDQATLTLSVARSSDRLRKYTDFWVRRNKRVHPAAGTGVDLRRSDPAAPPACP
eukprot:8820197-Pyramimonas_sp.AAC.1